MNIHVLSPVMPATAEGALKMPEPMTSPTIRTAASNSFSVRLGVPGVEVSWDGGLSEAGFTVCNRQKARLKDRNAYCKQKYVFSEQESKDTYWQAGWKRLLKKLEKAFIMHKTISTGKVSQDDKQDGDITEWY